jgi:REP element-mobilizing transposase RayT
VNPRQKALDQIEEATRLLGKRRDAAATFSQITYFDRGAAIGFLSGDLPHWRQEGAAYFVTFRLADSLPQEKLRQLSAERELWLQTHPEPHDEVTRLEYYELFPQRLQQWLDAGTGSCVLAILEVKRLVEQSLRHFDGQRYRIHESVVAPNHVHVLVSPFGKHTLSQILHCWKSFTAHEILKVEAASRRLSEANRSLGGTASVRVWQKESFDHLVRNPASMERFRDYIRRHPGAQSV